MTSATPQPETAAPAQNGGRLNKAEKAPKIPEETWQSYKGILESLYLKQNTKMADLMKIMEEKYGFTASEQQFRTKFRDWKFFKNKKSDKRPGSPERGQPMEKRTCTAADNLKDQTSTQTGNNTRIGVTPEVEPLITPPELDGTQYPMLPGNNLRPLDNVGTMNNANLGPNVDFGQNFWGMPFYGVPLQGQPAAYFPGNNPYGPMQPPFFQQPQYLPPMVDEGWFDDIMNKELSPLAGGHVNIIATGKGTAPSSSASTKVRQAIHQAAQAGSFNMVECILEEDPKCADILDTEGVSALWIAAQQGYKKIVELLIKHKAQLNTATTDSRRTPIHQAAQNGHLEVVKLLLSHGAEADPRDNENVTPLWSAAQQGYYEIVKILLGKGADKEATRDDGCRRPFHQAAQNGHVKVVKLLLDQGVEADPRDDQNITPLWSAAQQGHCKIVEMLLEKDVDLEATSRDGSRRPIHQAAQNGHVEIAQMLLQHGAQANPEVDAFDSTIPSPLWCAAQNGNAKIAELLIEREADVNISVSPSKRRPLHQAAQGGHVEVVRLLIKHGAELDAREEDSWPPIMIAAQQGYIDIINLLIEGGANVNAEEKDGATALWIASQQGHAEVVEKLLSAGAKAFATRSAKRRPIHQATQNGHLEVVKLLVECGQENVHAEEHKGATPICLAAQGKEPDRVAIVKYLISKGAKVTN